MQEAGLFLFRSKKTGPKLVVLYLHRENGKTICSNLLIQPKISNLN